MPAAASAATSGAGTPSEPKVGGSPWTSCHAGLGPDFPWGGLSKDPFRAGWPDRQASTIRGNQPLTRARHHRRAGYGSALLFASFTTAQPGPRSWSRPAAAAASRRRPEARDHRRRWRAGRLAMPRITFRPFRSSFSRRAVVKAWAKARTRRLLPLAPGAAGGSVRPAVGPGRRRIRAPVMGPPRPEGRILVLMKPARAASRRFLPGIPSIAARGPPIEQFAVRHRGHRR